jgi:transcriptional regulator with XRE-family HTH domain
LPRRADAARWNEQRAISAKLAKRVDALAKERGWTDEQLAGHTQLSLRVLRGLKKNHVDPALTTVLRLCRGLGVSVETLLGGLPLPETPRPRLRARASRRAPSSAGGRKAKSKKGRARAAK